MSQVTCISIQLETKDYLFNVQTTVTILAALSHILILCFPHVRESFIVFSQILSRSVHLWFMGKNSQCSDGFSTSNFNQWLFDTHLSFYGRSLTA